MGLGALLAATAAHGQEAPICTDRPTKANAVCTVPVGDWQLESSAVGWTRTTADGGTTDVLILGSSVVKLGVSSRSDLQIGFTPFLRVTSKTAGQRERESGFGDMVVRYKHRLTAADAKIQVAAIPFVKLPTADDDLGNGKVEGGLAVPVSFALGNATLTLGPEVDLLADSDGHGRHAAIVQLVNLAAPVAPRLTLVGELWTNWNFDPDGTVRQASADVAAAYAVTSNFQVDGGANFGLTRDTADIELYAGASIRF
jgi:hypothetical protein